MGTTNLDILSVNHLITPQFENTTGKIYYVNNGTATLPDGAIGGSNGNDGLSPLRPFATIDYAVGRCKAGRDDIVYIMPSHSETLTAPITCDVEGVSIIGLGSGDNRPEIATSANIDRITVTSKNVKIANLRFTESLVAHTSCINIDESYCKVYGCEFLQGANELVAITITANGDDSHVSGNEFKVTANGPDYSIHMEGTSTRNYITENIFDGGDNTNKWDNAAIYSNAAAQTNCLIAKNTIMVGIGIDLANTTTGMIVDNLGGDPFDVGRCEYIATGGQSTVNFVAGSSGETGESAGGDGSITGNIYYVGGALGNDANDGSSPSTAFATLQAAIDACTSYVDDAIMIMPIVTLAITTEVAVDKSGIKIIGLAQGESKPFITGGALAGGAGPVLNVTGEAVEIAGIHFTATTDATSTHHIEVAASTDNFYIHDCLFSQGVHTDDAIVFAGESFYSRIINCVFECTVDGPLNAITMDSASVNGLIVSGCTFYARTGGHEWDNGAIFSSAASVNNLIKDNKFLGGIGINLNAASTGLLAGNSGGKPYQPGACVVDDLGDTAVRFSWALLQGTTGAVYYVDATTGLATNNGLDPTTPLDDLAAAVAVANAGDVIVLMAGHSEALAAGIDINQANIRIVGLGNGNYTPAFSVDSGGGGITGITISAAGVEVDNIVVSTNGGAAAATLMAVTGVSSSIKNCRFNQTDGAATAIDLGDDASFAKVSNNEFFLVPGGAGALNAVLVSNVAAEDIQVSDNYFRSTTVANSWSTAAVYGNLNVVRAVVRNNVFFNPAATRHGVSFAATSTGILEGNVVHGANPGYGIVGGTMDVGTGNEWPGNFSDVFPSSAGAVTITGGAGAWGQAGYVQVIAAGSIQIPFRVVGICIEAVSGAGTFEFEIGIGAGGSEVTSGWARGLIAAAPDGVILPCKSAIVPTGSRVAVDVSTLAGGAQTADITLLIEYL